jgi:hypothetical protein
VLGDQTRHLVLVGAMRGFHSRSGPEQHTVHHWGLRHPVSVTHKASDGNPLQVGTASRAG